MEESFFQYQQRHTQVKLIKLAVTYRVYGANRDKRKQHIFSSENDRFDLKTDSDRSFKPILYF